MKSSLLFHIRQQRHLMLVCVYSFVESLCGEHTDLSWVAAPIMFVIDEFKVSNL